MCRYELPTVAAVQATHMQIELLAECAARRCVVRMMGYEARGHCAAEANTLWKKRWPTKFVGREVPRGEYGSRCFSSPTAN